MRNQNEPTVLDLFSGIGGFSIGHNFKQDGAMNYEDFICSNIRCNGTINVAKIIERACLEAQLELLNEFLLKPVKEFPRCLLEKRDEIEAKLKAIK
jgi:hypothetical protein